MAFDPDFGKVSLLLHMDGAYGSTTFNDSSPAAKAVAASGNAKVSAAESKWGGASLALGGSGDYLSAPAHADFAFDVGDFTVELWINTTTAAEKALVDQYDSGNPNSWQLAVRSGWLSWYSNGYVLGGATAVNDGAWHHVAAVRSAGTLRFFVDGVLDGSAALGHNFNTNLVLGIGAQVAERNSAYDFPGYIDELRITKGVGRYTANFAPPTEAFPNSATEPVKSAYAATPTPLGTPAVLAASGEAFFVRAAAATPLGTPLALARAVGAARVATAGPLGAGAALGRLVAVARAMAMGPLGAPASLARTRVYAQASVPSPLGDPAVRANQPHVFARAQGFNSTAFGAPSFATRLQAAGFNSTAFGVPSSPVPQTVVASGFSKTYFGGPFGFQYIQPKINQVVSASSLATTQFGLPSAFIDVTVQAAGSTSGQFGTPTTKLGLGAQAIAPATSWGAPLLLLSMHAQGFCSTSFGVPHAAMVQHAASTYRATRWGLPTCTRSNTYLARSIASTPRFGRPTARKINAYQASSMTPSGQFGTPACALRYRALGIHGGARFGKPLLIRSAAC